MTSDVIPNVHTGLQQLLYFTHWCFHASILNRCLDCLNEGRITLEYCPTSEMVADELNQQPNCHTLKCLCLVYRVKCYVVWVELGYV